MLHDQLATVDRYITDLLVLPGAALEAGAAAGLPPHNVSPNQGRPLMRLTRPQGARSWRSARWAATARSGSLGRCPPTVV